MAALNPEKIKPTSTIVASRLQPTAQSGNSPICDGAQSQQRLGAQAKAIMDEFVKALDKAGEVSGEIGLEREQATREGKKSKPDNEFRERMLKNAPKKDLSHIIAERKSW